MGETLKLGVVGAGFVAGFHARALQQVRSMEISGITSRTGTGLPTVLRKGS